MNDGPAKRCPACRHRRPRPQDLRQLRCADDSVTALAVDGSHAVDRIVRTPDHTYAPDRGPSPRPGPPRPGEVRRERSLCDPLPSRSATASVGSVSTPHRSSPTARRRRAAARSTSRAAAARCGSGPSPPRRSRPARPDRDEHAGRRARPAAHDGDRGHRVRPGAGATLRRAAARVCVVVSAWSRLAPTTARPPAHRAEAVRPGPPPEPNVPNVPGPTRRRSRHRQDVVHPLTRSTTGMQAVAAQASS